MLRTAGGVCLGLVLFVVLVVGLLAQSWPLVGLVVGLIVVVGLVSWVAKDFRRPPATPTYRGDNPYLR